MNIEEGHAYKGHTYSFEIDTEPDNIKIFHDVILPSGKRVHMDWSPYTYPTAEEFEVWVDLGLPGRRTTGPLDSRDLRELAEDAWGTEVARVALSSPQRSTVDSQEAF